MTEDILLQVRKPARYIGQEWNVARKDFERAEVKFALCFPDLYEIGMSNLGFRIIYDIINKIEDASCERFFSPACDMENILRAGNRRLTSLESARPLSAFDLAGFSLGYELGFTNVLNILELGGIPLKAGERGKNMPLVIGGGPCVLNPEPMHEFFDLFLIGEAEEAISEIIALYRRLKDEFRKGKLSKEELLTRFCRIEGVYVPSLYEAEYSADGQIKKIAPRIEGIPSRVKKRFLNDLSGAPYPLDWLLPYIEIVHDRINLELMRGCPNGCRFCQARQFYAPPRYRSVEKILSSACAIYRSTGYEEISLTGLSVSDYPHMEILLPKMIDLFREKAINISLPSIKPKALLGNFASLIATVKKTGLTFAPEAATEKLRRVLNKDFDLESFYEALEQAYASGYRRVKLYFMIGLPGEEDGDLDGILDFVNSVSELKRKIDGHPAQINTSINALIPKPHTSFQWFGMAGIESVEAKAVYLRRKLKNRRIKLTFHDSKMSFLEGVFSRGDRRLGRVIELAFRKGARFDGWSEYFVFERWMEAFREAGIDPEFYLKAKSREDILPWDLLELPAAKEDLLKEYDKIVDIK